MDIKCVKQTLLCELTHKSLFRAAVISAPLYNKCSHKIMTASKRFPDKHVFIF